MKAKEILEKALESFGPDGAGWAKGYSSDDKKSCSVHACWRVSQPADTSTEYMKVLDSLLRALPEGEVSVVGFNDRSSTTFADIQGVFNRAIQGA